MILLLSNQVKVVVDFQMRQLKVYGGLCPGSGCPMANDDQIML